MCADFRPSNFLFLYATAHALVVYCPKCGSQNADDAAYCAKCGNLLPTTLAAAPAPASSYPPPAGFQNPVQGKDPYVAALLNLFFGLGYIYLGKNKVLGVPTIVFVLLALVIFIVVSFVTFFLGTLILAILLACDGYEKGRGQKGFVSAE